MPTLRCPRCATLVTASAGGTASCPSCGFTAQVPDVPKRSAPPARPARPPPAREPEPLPPEPPLTAPPADWPAADWTAASPVPSSPTPAPSPSPMTPVAGAAPAWGERGKTVSPGAVALLSVVTVGIYLLFFWWRVSGEADLLKGRRHSHGLAKVGILMTVLGALVAALFLAAALAQVYAERGTPLPETARDLEQAIMDASPAYLAAIALAVVVAFVGTILLYVAQWRAWTSIRDAELAAGRADTVNPALYLFLPLGLRLAASVVDPASSALGDLLTFAGLVLAVVYAALTQAHLNRLWSLGVAPPAPAPVAR